MSLSLFALALEPLAILVRNFRLIEGWRFGPLEEKILLYGDDTLLYLRDGNTALRINWSKSVLFPLNLDARGSALATPLVWVEEFKYLGIKVSRDLNKFYDLNIHPVLLQLKDRCTSWSNLSLNVLGRINILKIIFLPKFLCVS